MEKKTFEEAREISNAVLELCLHCKSMTCCVDDGIEYRRAADEIILRNTGWTTDEIGDECCKRLADGSFFEETQL